MTLLFPSTLLRIEESLKMTPLTLQVSIFIVRIIKIRISAQSNIGGYVGLYLGVSLSQVLHISLRVTSHVN